MKIVWSGEAKRQFWRVIDYLFDKWTEEDVLKFRNNVDELTKNIAENTNLCPQSKMHNLRKCLIDKQNSLVYLLQNEIIYIVALVDNRSAHSY